MAISERSSGVSFSARARPPLSPPRRPNDTAAGSLVSGTASSCTSPVAISTISLARWFGSVGLFRGFDVSSMKGFGFVKDMSTCVSLWDASSVGHPSRCKGRIQNESLPRFRGIQIRTLPRIVVVIQFEFQLMCRHSPARRARHEFIRRLRAIAPDRTPQEIHVACRFAAISPRSRSQRIALRLRAHHQGPSHAHPPRARLAANANLRRHLLSIRRSNACGRHHLDRAGCRRHGARPDYATASDRGSTGPRLFSSRGTPTGAYQYAASLNIPPSPNTR